MQVNHNNCFHLLGCYYIGGGNSISDDSTSTLSSSYGTTENTKL